MAFSFLRRRATSSKTKRCFSSMGQRRCGIEPLEDRRLLAVVASDGFETGDFSGGSGVWSNDWQQSGGGRSLVTSSSSPQIGTYHALLQGSRDVQRTVDISGLTNLRLQFGTKLRSFENSDDALVEARVDGGPWTTLAQFGNGDDDNQYRTYDLAIPFTGNTLEVRLNGQMSSSRWDYWYIDDVQVEGTAAGPPEVNLTNASATEGDLAMRFIDSLISPQSGGLEQPRGIEIGPDGNIYVSGQSHHTDPVQEGMINRYDAESGEFLGVFASHPALTGAKDVEFGPDGNLYVPNNQDHNVLRFDGATGAFIDIFIPSGSGGLNVPRNLIFGPDGNGDGQQDIYISSANTDSVLRYDGMTGAFIDAFVAPGSGGLNSPTAIAFGPYGDFFVASGAHQDFYNSILLYDGVTGEFDRVFVEAGEGGLTLAPTAGMIFGPDVTGDGTDDLYVSNGEVDEVLIFNGRGGDFVTTLVSAGLGALDDPKGLEFDADGNLLVVGNGDYSVKRFGAASQAVFYAQLSHPSGTTVTVDYSMQDVTAIDGNDYFASSGTLIFEPGVTSRAIVVPTIDNLEIEGSETLSVSLNNPTGGAALGDSQGVGTILDDDASRSISISDAEVTEGDQEFRYLDDFVPLGNIFPEHMTFGPDGNLYVAGAFSDTVRRYDAQTGNLIDEFVEKGSGGLLRPFGIAFGPDGNFYVSSRMDRFGTGQLLRYDGATGDFIDTFVDLGDGGLDNPNGFVFGPDGDLFVTSRHTHEILRYDGETGAFKEVFVTPGSGGLQSPIAVTFGPDDHFYVTMGHGTGTAQVLRYDGDTGAFIDEFVPAAQSGRLWRPLYLEFGPDGDLYVTSSLSNAILKYDGSTGAFVEEYVAAPSGNLTAPSGFIFGEDGNFYVANRLDWRLEVLGGVARFGPASQAVFTVNLSQPSSQRVSLDYSVIDGTASAGDDFEAASGTLIFEPGITTRSIVVSTLDDDLPEDAETFEVVLSNPIGALIADGQATGTILDDGDVGNQTPIVNAGADQTVGDPDGSGDQTVVLNGVANDPDGTIASHKWTLGSTVLGNTPSISPSLAVGVHTLTLTVTDDEGATASDDVIVTINPNELPVADAGANQTVTDSDENGSEPVTLNGFSSDSDGSIVAYEWKEGTNVLGTTASISPALSVGVHTLTFTVTDNGGATTSDTVVVTVDEVPTLTPPPVAKGVVQAGSGGWTSVSLGGLGFTDPVIIATPNYDSSLPPMVSRISNVSGAGFDLKVQPTDAGATSISNVSVHYIVVEAGTYTIASNGVQMEARSIVSDTTAENNNWNQYENVGYLQSYSNPVVVGQVMSTNDIDWSAFYATGSSRTAPPSSSTLRVGKHVGEDADTTRSSETIGFLVIEAGSGTIDGLPYEAGLGGDSVKGVDDAPSYDYSLSLPQASYVAAVSQAGMDGGNGGWAMLYGNDPVTPNQLRLAIDEDQMKDSERKHTTEQVAYFVIDPPVQQEAPIQTSIDRDWGRSLIWAGLMPQVPTSHDSRQGELLEFDSYGFMGKLQELRGQLYQRATSFSPDSALVEFSEIDRERPHLVDRLFAEDEFDWDMIDNDETFLERMLVLS